MKEFINKGRTITVNRVRIDVSEEVYIGYYQELEKERYQNRLKRRYESSFEELVDMGFSVESNMTEKIETTEEYLMNKYMFEKLNLAITLLSEEEKYIIWNIFFYNKTIRDIADDMSISKTKVFNKKAKALKKIKKILGDI